MRKEKAKLHYSGKEGHKKLNCAQAVIAAFHDEFDAPAEAVDAFASLGGGRSPEGRCGALHAAHYLISKKDPSKTVQLEQEFLEAAGSLKCKEIRSKRKLTCLECVETAAEYLQRGLDKN
jgi:hypothetical protein